jgi:hypothetical protein
MNIKRWIDRVLSKSVFTQACLWVALVSFVFNLLAQTEHNRWNIEKLLMDYRATTPEEAEKITTGKQSKKDYRKKFIHNDIRAYQTLTMDDDGIHVSWYDVNITKSLPLTLRELDKLKTTV